MANEMMYAEGAFANQDDYDWDSDGQIKRGSSGVAILRVDCDAVVKKPSWFGKETVFRPYPYLSDPRDQNSPFESYRIIDGTKNKFSNWLRRYICAWNVGNPSTTFIIRRPTGAQVFDPVSTPLGILYRAINNAVKRGQSHPEWAPLLMKVAGKSPTLAGPKECYVMQGALFRHDGKDYFGNYGDPLGFGKNPPLVLLCSGGAGEDMCQKLSEEVDNYHGDPLDFEARYKTGDPVGCGTGRFFHFFEKGRNPYQNRYASQPQGGNASNDDGWGTSAGAGQKRTKEIGFDVYISPDFEGLPAKFNAAGERIVRNKIRAWDELLYFPTEVEQAHMLFKCFPLSACMYAFEGVNKDWIPEDAYKRAANTVTVPVGGYGQPQPHGYDQQVSSYARPAQQPAVSSWAQPAPPQRPVTRPVLQDTTVPTEDVAAVDAAFGFKAPSPQNPAAKVEAPSHPMSEAPAPPVTAKKSAGTTAAAVAKLADARSKMS